MVFLGGWAVGVGNIANDNNVLESCEIRDDEVDDSLEHGPKGQRGNGSQSPLARAREFVFWGRFE